MTETKHIVRTDLKKLDKHTPAKSEYGDAPELTDAQLERAVFEVAGKPVGRSK
jgi:hypothetical protein